MAQYDIREGMTVRDIDGHKLGKVAEVRGDMFIIEKGLIFKDDFEARQDHIIALRGDEIIYSRADELGTERRQERPSGQEEELAAGDLAGPSAQSAATATRSEAAKGEVRVPLAEEELDIQKHARQRAGVRITKEVVTEHKQVSVPVTREEVKVERVALGDEATAPRAAGAFVEEEVTVPIIEEEVTVTKRPVVQEEVRVRKEQRQEERAVAADVRREEANIENLSEERRERPAESEPGMRAPSRDDDLKR